MEPRLMNNLDELLKFKGLRASDLSKITGIPKQTLSEWRAGLVPKSVVALKKVAEAFGISLDELIFKDKVSEGLGAISGAHGPHSSLRSALHTLSGFTSAALWVSDELGISRLAADAETSKATDTSAMEGRPWIEQIAPECHAELHEFLKRGGGGSHETVILRPDLSLAPVLLLHLRLKQQLSLFFAVDSESSALRLYDESVSCQSVELFNELRRNFSGQAWARGSELRLHFASNATITVRRRALVSLLFNFTNSLALAAPDLPIDLSIQGDEQSLNLRFEIAAPALAPLLEPLSLSDALQVAYRAENSALASTLHLQIPLYAHSH